METGPVKKNRINLIDRTSLMEHHPLNLLSSEIRNTDNVTQKSLRELLEKDTISRAEFLELSDELNEKLEARIGHLKSNAVIDDLTGIMNRRALNEQLSELVEKLRHKEHKRESDLDFVVLFFLDLNRFKFLNDTYGHHVGDEALQLVARRLEKEAHERGGQVFRLQGDEFVITQGGKGELREKPEVTASRLQSKINSDLFLPLNGGSHFNVTVSVGCVEVKKGRLNKTITNEKIAELMIRGADKRMKSQKKDTGVERGK